MLKELIAIGMATTLMTAPPQNANDGTYYQDVNITETYEYETNEVNSVDDLVVGNIYRFNSDNIATNQYNYAINISYFKDINTIYYGATSAVGIPNELPRIYVATMYSNYKFNLQMYSNTTSNTVFGFSCSDIDAYIVYEGVDNINYLNYQFFTASDYLGEKTITVEPVETEGLYNMAYHFLYSRIYTNTELQAMETTLFGTTINMNMWLSHTTAIVIICLLLIVLIKFVIWLFKIVSGGILWQ